VLHRKDSSYDESKNKNGPNSLSSGNLIIVVGLGPQMMASSPLNVTTLLTGAIDLQFVHSCIILPSCLKNMYTVTKLYKAAKVEESIFNIYNILYKGAK
jgi:hypothetical protein